MMKSRRMRWEGHVARMGEKRLLVGKPEGRPRQRWVDNIRMYLLEVGWGDVDWTGLDWTGLAQDRDRWTALVDSVLNLQVP
jgi:hypothetical protein